MTEGGDNIIMVYSSTVNTTRDVLKYIGQYQGHLFVIRIDDQLLKTPLFSMFIKDVVLLHRLGIQIVLVPSARLSICLLYTSPSPRD